MSTTVLIIITSFLFWINVIAFGAYAMDKHYAYYNLWRIPEAVLITLAVVGGAFGALTAMLLFRHKTRHRLFTICVPVSLLAWVMVLTVVLISGL